MEASQSATPKDFGWGVYFFAGMVALTLFWAYYTQELWRGTFTERLQ